MSFNYLNKDGLQYFWNKIKAKIGTATLTTTAQDLSGAVNELNSNLDNKSIKMIETTLPSDTSSLTVNYPAGTNKDNLLILNFGYYRNAGWEYNFDAISLTLINAGIVITIKNDYTHIRGLPLRIYYSLK